jgi:hypothetical protein
MKLDDNLNDRVFQSFSLDGSAREGNRECAA